MANIFRDDEDNKLSEEELYEESRLVKFTQTICFGFNWPQQKFSL